MKIFNFKDTEQGFSLIEIMLSMAIMSIVSIAFAVMVGSQFNQVKLLEDKIKKSSLEQELINTVSDYCVNNIVGVTIALDKNNIRDINSIVNSAGDVLIQDGQTRDGFIIGDMVIKNKSIDAASSLGNITVEIPIERSVGVGIKDLKPIEIEIRVAVDSSLEITTCVGPKSLSIDPSGLDRDGWLCTCNGDFTSSTEGGSTVCMNQVKGALVDMWVAPDPWTKATGGNFNCASGNVPNPPGTQPVLKWTYYYYSSVTNRCNMNVGDSKPKNACP